MRVRLSLDEPLKFRCSETFLRVRDRSSPKILTPLQRSCRTRCTDSAAQDVGSNVKRRVAKETESACSRRPRSVCWSVIVPSRCNLAKDPANKRSNLQRWVACRFVDILRVRVGSVAGCVACSRVPRRRLPKRMFIAPRGRCPLFDRPERGRKKSPGLVSLRLKRAERSEVIPGTAFRCGATN